MDRNVMSEKIQKVLAQMGLGSRREIEAWISQGRVELNGQVAKLGERMSSVDRVKVDGKPIRLEAIEEASPRVIAYHKPEGEICTADDPEGRKTVFAHLPHLRSGRWVMVGRLDINTSGLLLFTTDGELANRLMHPSYEINREYAVRVFGEVLPETLQKLKKGVMLEDGPAKFDSIVAGGGEGINHWYHVTLKEGRNREVRRLWESQGVKVSRLSRVAFGPIVLPRALRTGRYQELTLAEVNLLREQVKLPPLNEQKVARPKSTPPKSARRVMKDEYGFEQKKVKALPKKGPKSAKPGSAKFGRPYEKTMKDRPAKPTLRLKKPKDKP